MQTILTAKNVVLRQTDWVDLDRSEKSLRAGVVTSCPCCDSTLKIYQRSINATMARQLIKLSHFNGYTHTSHLIPSGLPGSGDFTKLRYWGFIEEKSHDRKEHPEKRSSGYWRITPDGLEFVNLRIKAQKYAHVYQGKVIDFSGDMVSILKCLGDKFNYSELMGGFDGSV